jgi:putative transposase|tara:strand:+ start:120 stop:1337 length:1218 start_codon:yes stop_codon:yes gene_type:complete
MTRQNELIDELLKSCKTPEDILGEGGLLKQLTKAVVERALEGEMTDHLGYTKYSPIGKTRSNSRNGKTSKTIQGKHGKMDITVPRDRDGEFKPQLIPKHHRRFDGFDDKIISMYARGMTTRDIRGQLEDLYGVDVSPTFISTVTDAVLDEVRQWQTRPLDPLYPIVYLDAIRIKGRHEGHIMNKAVYLAIGINTDGLKEVLGMWIAKTEGAKFWLSVLNELKNRGLEDIFIASVDGLKGFPDAIETVYPHTQVQLCIVHMVRNSLKYVSWKQRKEMATDLKTIYRASTIEEAQSNLDAFAQKWDNTHPNVSKAWRDNWTNLSTFFDYPKDIRKVIYTTNAIESLNMSLRKVTKTRGSFPNDDAIFKILYLALRNAAKKWTMPIQNWKAAMNQFSIMFEDRMAHLD